MKDRKKQAKILRDFRKIHRICGASLFIFFFIISITGLLLGWKKNSNGILLTKTYKGSTTELKEWLPIDILYQKASTFLLDSISPTASLEMDRIDIRKEKGIAKFIFVDNNSLQLDGATGEILVIENRHSDWIEAIHDGSIIDDYFNLSGDPFKLIYTSVMGIALLIFTITGFWLWYGPKRMKKSKS